MPVKGWKTGNKRLDKNNPDKWAKADTEMQGYWQTLEAEKATMLADKKQTREIATEVVQRMIPRLPSNSMIRTKVITIHPSRRLEGE